MRASLATGTLHRIQRRADAVRFPRSRVPPRTRFGDAERIQV
ncbi:MULTISPECIES: hypothetical protein [Lysobacter]|uniref:Uncharacterized protein n=1 Tax=Lysobacter yananisis TaxID=1003114 RepID=A0ABY9PBR7_9GAMM|nr:MULTISPECIES: hypothetical protein [Lysobacter]WMT04215.1 hypothetical protein RDV84_05040 [Lysobacter yananisis]